MSRKKLYFNIDVLGVCNLSCPSCPTGNMPDLTQRTKGLMEPELLNRILDKAVAECEVTGVGLFNWTEPLLHPRIAELVRSVKSRGIPCQLSANLNVMKNIEAVLAENLDSLRISMSGFTQEVYGYTHRGGNIERVKQNMAALAQAKKRTNSNTLIHVLYHRYKANLDDELLARDYSLSLGFDFVPVWAMMMPVEKILAYAYDDSEYAALTQEDHKIIQHLALPLREALEAGKRKNTRTCTLQDDQMTLDHRGDVALCCGIYDMKRFSLGAYLDIPVDKLQELKFQHNLCSSCMGCGAHVYITYGTSELDRIASDRLDPKHVKALGLGMERVGKKVRAGLKQVYSKVAARWITPARAKRLESRYRQLMGGIQQVKKAPQERG